MVNSLSRAKRKGHRGFHGSRKEGLGEKGLKSITGIYKKWAVVGLGPPEWTGGGAVNI